MLNPEGVRRLREALGMSQAELARRTGVSSQHVYQVERGVGGASVEWLRRAETVFEEAIMKAQTHLPGVTANAPGDGPEPGVAALLDSAALKAALTISADEARALLAIRAGGAIRTAQQATALLAALRGATAP
jgi:transcriptional regulator with XRE-family HTH domain